MSRITFLDTETVDYGDISLTSLRTLGEFTHYGNTTPAEISERIRDAELVITNKCVFDRAVFESAPQLKLLLIAATGVNNVDLEAARASGCQVRNVAGYSTDAVVERTFGFLLALAGHAAHYELAAKDGRWCASPHFTLPGPAIIELKGKVLGIAGYGTIGQRVAEIARVFGMKVWVAALPGRDYSPEKGLDRKPLDAVLRGCDFLTLHCPLSKQTQALLGENEIARMKPTAYLINTARGGIVDELALLKALEQGRIAGAAVDVLSQEPPSEDQPLLGAPNLILTPHVAWASREARQRLVDEIALNIESYFRGEDRNRVA
ncbi:MAG: D-2-hydroxyacid dehydrogenase [Candidatus Omnitrophica bacterium]|nr:D-2-hydroxyacid dehydrogenase [Candidatus Omnitrophota bacterium]